ncbi:uncharacterized protein LOC128254588 [Drosophila gunungcola]|uniref:Uncharacterized protein n=1 Tax=Drosophila gunungcola TaxID=103775 RepID=A0A9Q0BNY5_9MUSC|nr:uncharacterized protein LOC128254588 [Drosophila gunungcola]KAI8038449.1 hypothetical protein M5D96_008347 [Drosophila gunungcola]
MYRSNHIFWALALFGCISIADGETKKHVVFNNIECSMRNKVFSRVDCHLQTRLALNIFATINDQKAVDKLMGVCDVKIDPHGQQKMIRVRNIKLDFCQLKKNTENGYIIGIYYSVIRKAIVDFPDKCPFQKNTTLAIKRLHMGWQDVPKYMPLSNFSFFAKVYAGNELGLVVKLTGGLYEFSNVSGYKYP